MASIKTPVVERSMVVREGAALKSISNSPRGQRTALCFIPYVLISYFMNKTISGWTSLMMVVIFFGSLQLLILGIIGLYFSKMVIQTKQRPLYFVRDTNYPSQARLN